jgi:hypothetical protein
LFWPYNSAENNLNKIALSKVIQHVQEQSSTNRLLLATFVHPENVVHHYSSQPEAIYLDLVHVVE